MKISEVQRDTRKDQARLMAKIVTRRQKIAALQNEIDQLQNELIQVAAENVAWWDGVAPTDCPEPGCSEMNIVPLPTTMPEKIFINGSGVFSSFDGVTR